MPVQVSNTGAPSTPAIPGSSRKSTYRPPTPVAIDVQRQQVVHRVIARSDLAEHLADSRIALINRFTASSRGLGAGVLGATAGIVIGILVELGNLRRNCWFQTAKSGHQCTSEIRCR